MCTKADGSCTCASVCGCSALTLGTNVFPFLFFVHCNAHPHTTGSAGMSPLSAFQIQADGSARKRNAMVEVNENSLFCLKYSVGTAATV